MTLVQRLRAQGVFVRATDRFIGPFPPEYMRRAETLKQELREERENGARIATSLNLDAVEPCDHVWELIPGAGLQPLLCGKCGGCP